MAKKYSNNPIPDKYTDWGKDPTYYNYPFSGRSVQEYIKKQFDNKVGYIHPDASNENYLLFADEDNYNIYIQDPIEHADLLICSISKDSSLVSTVEDGFYITDEQGYVIFSATSNGINFVDKINTQLVSDTEYDINI